MERNPRRNAERDAKDYETILNGMILFEMMRNDKRSWVEILMGREKLERNSDKVIDFCSKHSILGEKFGFGNKAAIYLGANYSQVKHNKSNGSFSVDPNRSTGERAAKEDR